MNRLVRRAGCLVALLIPLWAWGADHGVPAKPGGSPTAAGHTAGLDADEALARLKKGNWRFHSADFSNGKPVAAARRESATGQHPYAVVVACADSRVPPELVFDANLGELFVVRAAGNLLDAYGLGSVEYAVDHLGCRLVVVLGHERCGAVQAALGAADAPGHVGNLVRDLQDAVAMGRAMPGDALHNSIIANAVQVATQIRREGQFGQAAEDVQVISAFYDLDSGEVSWPGGAAPTDAPPGH
jgi:carbonic anhydrase